MKPSRVPLLQTMVFSPLAHCQGGNSGWWGKSGRFSRCASTWRCCRTDASKQFPTKGVLNPIQNQWVGAPFLFPYFLWASKENRVASAAKQQAKILEIKKNRCQSNYRNEKMALGTFAKIKVPRFSNEVACEIAEIKKKVQQAIKQKHH